MRGGGFSCRSEKLGCAGVMPLSMTPITTFSPCRPRAVRRPADPSSRPRKAGLALVFEQLCAVFRDVLHQRIGAQLGRLLRRQAGGEAVEGEAVAVELGVRCADRCEQLVVAFRPGRRRSVRTAGEFASNLPRGVARGLPGIALRSVRATMAAGSTQLHDVDAACRRFRGCAGGLIGPGSERQREAGHRRHPLEVPPYAWPHW